MSDGKICCPGAFYGLWCSSRWGLSPVLLTVYVDDTKERLNDYKLGCFIGDLHLGCIMYADDLILISTSVSMF